MTKLNKSELFSGAGVWERELMIHRAGLFSSCQTEMRIQVHNTANSTGFESEWFSGL